MMPIYAFRLVLAVVFVAPIFGHAARAEPIEVDCNPDALVEAIVAANATQEPDEIELAAQCLYSFDAAADIDPSTGDSALPKITAPLTIWGNDATIERNHSAPDFGIIYVQQTDLTLRDVAIRGGSVGAGITVNYATVSIIGSEVSGNAGSGIRTSPASTLTIVSSVIAGNSSPLDGGGIFNAGSLTVISSSITGNSARAGGGILNYFESGSFIIASTITGNSAAGEGGSIASYGWLSINSSILWGNGSESGGSSEIFVDPAGGAGTEVFGNIVQGGYGAGNSDGDPLFVSPLSYEDAPTVEGDYRLQPDSPAVGAGLHGALDFPADEFDIDNDGDAIEPLPFDAAGEPRIVNVLSDVGAYELQERASGSAPQPTATATISP